MNKHIVSALLVAVLAAGSGLAQAQRGPGGPGGPGQPGHDRGPDRGPGHGPDNGRGPGNNHGSSHGPQGHAPDRHPDRAPAHWHKGERVPQPYRGRQYIVNDWHGHQLRRPPRGYQWVGVGADYFLIGVASGIVLESVLGH